MNAPYVSSHRKYLEWEERERGWSSVNVGKVADDDVLHGGVLPIGSGIPNKYVIGGYSSLICFFSFTQAVFPEMVGFGGCVGQFGRETVFFGIYVFRCMCARRRVHA